MPHANVDFNIYLSGGDKWVKSDSVSLMDLLRGMTREFMKHLEEEGYEDVEIEDTNVVLGPPQPDQIELKSDIFMWGFGFPETGAGEKAMNKDLERIAREYPQIPPEDVAAKLKEHGLSKFEFSSMDITVQDVQAEIQTDEDGELIED